MIQPSLMAAPMRSLPPLAPRFGDIPLTDGTPAPRPYKKALEQFQNDPKSFTTWVMGGISKSKDGKAVSGGFTAKTPDGGMEVSYSLGKKWGIFWTEHLTVTVNEQTATSSNNDSYTLTKLSVGFSRKKAVEGSTQTQDNQALANARGWLDKIAAKPIGFLKD